jgi:hypothetical protein
VDSRVDAGHAAVLARFTIAVELGRAPPGSQGFLEGRGELVRTVGQLHASQACLHRFVVGGQFEKNGRQGGHVLSLQERIQAFGGYFGHR